MTHFDVDDSAMDDRPRTPSVGRRYAAGVALGASAAAVVTSVVAFLDDPLRLAGVLICLVVAVVSGWIALLRRGIGRLAMLAVAVASLITIIVLLSGGSWLRMTALLALMLLASGAGGIALGYDSADATKTGRVVGPARRGVLFMNPRSGGGKVLRFDLEREARNRGVSPVMLRPGDDLRELAERAVADGADVIGMAGGDGSQALVADVARNHDVPVVVVPAGTRNHFALDLGLDRSDVAAALDAFTAAVERRVDLALIGDRVFVNNASLGVYATIVQSEGYRDAKVATAVRMMPDLLGPDAPPSTLRFRGPDGVEAAPAAVVLVSNGAYRLDSMGGFGTRPRLDAGVLGVVSLTIDRALDLPALMAAEAAGRLSDFRGYRQWTTGEFRVGSDEAPVDVGVDGEALRLPPPLTFRSLPGVLRVRTPLHGTGAGPVAMRPAGPGEAVGSLLRVLAGRPAR